MSEAEYAMSFGKISRLFNCLFLPSYSQRTRWHDQWNRYGVQNLFVSVWFLVNKNNRKCVFFFFKQIAELQKEKQKYEDMIVKATNVSEELDKLIKTKSEKDPLVVVNRRYRL